MKKLFSILLAAVMLVGMIPMSMIPAFAAELPTVEISKSNLPTTWGTEGQASAYTVTESCTIDDRVEVKGDVTLTLNDGVTLTLPKGIHLMEGNSLTIDSRSQGENMGKLTATGTDGNAAIGGNAGLGGSIWERGNAGDACGNLTINGGSIMAKGSGDTRGFGGGNGGEAVVNGGYIRGRGGAGGSGGQLSVNGGLCTFSAGSGAAIGGGSGGRADSRGAAGSATELTIDSQMMVRAGADANHATDTAYESQSYAHFGKPVTVTFNIPGINLSKTVVKGLPVPELLQTDGANYAVWYTDAALTVPYDFSQPVMRDMTLYGNWEPSPYAYEYTQWDAEGHSIEKTHVFNANDPHIIHNDNLPTTWGESGHETWYVVAKNCVINGRIEIKGNVNLILADGAELTLSNGIHLSAGNSLTVFSVSQVGESMGKLNANGTDGNAAIGGNAGLDLPNNTLGGNGDACGTLTINGGMITAKGSGNSRGFGGGEGGDAWINGGAGGAGGQLSILGGICTVSSASGAAIGGGTGGAARIPGYTGAATQLITGAKTFMWVGQDAEHVAKVKVYENQPYVRIENIIPIIIDSVEGGVVSAGKDYGIENEMITLTVKAEEYYKYVPNSLKVNNGTVKLTQVDESTYSFVMPDEQVTVTAAFEPTHIHDDGIVYKPWTNANALPTEAGNWMLATDVTLSSTWNVPAGTTNFCLNGHAVKAIGNITAINIPQKATFNLYDCNTTAKHHCILDENQVWTLDDTKLHGASLETLTERPEPGLTVEITGGVIAGGDENYNIGVLNNGIFNINAGVIIGGKTSGVSNGGAGTVNMNNGMIIGGRGRGALNSGTFNMNNGVIIGGRTGGMNTDGIFNMTDGKIIWAKSNGVTVAGNTFTMNGGTISGNTAYNTGGGVHVISGIFNMNGGTIKDNVSSGQNGSGGGVFVSSNGTFNMTDGAITGNRTEWYGGGVCVYGTFNFSGGTISNNTADGNGGGVYNKGSFTMSGGIISGNTAKIGGGLANNGKFNMSDGIIRDNTAEKDGNNVQRSGYDDFTQNGGSIIESTGSVLSDGNLWIILVVAVLAIGGIATLVIVKKKKKPATASGEADSDEE